MAFAPAVCYASGISPYWVAVGDFNADGAPDLAVANFDSDTVSVLLGDGAGGFTSAAHYQVGRHPLSVAAGDFDGDGTPALAVANGDSNTVSVLLSNGAAGSARRNTSSG